MYLNPPRSCVPCEKIEDDAYDWYQRHAAKLEEVKKIQADVVFIGDSITHFWGPEDGIGYGVKTWEKFYGKRRVLNLGYGFDRTQNMLWRIQNGELENQDPKVFVVNAGSNQFSVTPRYSGDPPAIAFLGAKALLSELYEKFPHAEFLVMALLPRDGNFGGSNMSIQSCLDAFNRLLEEWVRTQPRMKFINITRQMLTPEGAFRPELYADQRCHPNDKGYVIWAEAIEPELRRILGD